MYIVLEIGKIITRVLNYHKSSIKPPGSLFNLDGPSIGGLIGGGLIHKIK